MKQFKAIVLQSCLVFAVLAVGDVHAESSFHFIELIPEKSSSCPDRGPGDYRIDIVSGKLSLFPNNVGPMFTVSVPADGEVRASYKSPAGGSMEFSGNAHTRSFQLYNRSTNCVYKLVGKKPEFKP